jgi:hypothetical protein
LAAESKKTQPEMKTTANMLTITTRTPFFIKNFPPKNIVLIQP